MSNIFEYRCYNCYKKLAEVGAVGLEIKCPRCKTYNVIRKQDIETKNN